MVNDFEFIQPFGGNRVPTDERRKKSQKEIGVISIWSPHCEVWVTIMRCKTENKTINSIVTEPIIHKMEKVPLTSV
jgi:hypothetical protein